METKNSVRNLLRAQLQGLPENVRKTAALQVWERLRLDSGFQTAKVIASFASLPSEIDTRSIHFCGRKIGKTFVYPKVFGDQKPLRFFAVEDLQELDAGGRILEPKPEQHREVNEIELFLIPGLGFTREGGRLGRGKGYYDLTLSQPQFNNSPRYALAFNEQILDELEMEPHDVVMSKVFTPNAVFLGKTI